MEHQHETVDHNHKGHKAEDPGTMNEGHGTVNEDHSTMKHKHRSEEETRKLINRLKRLEGQIRGIRAMVEEDRYCIDILTQCSAAQSALNAFSKELLSEHIQSCVLHDVRMGNEEEAASSVQELVDAVQKLMK